MSIRLRLSATYQKFSSKYLHIKISNEEVQKWFLVLKRLENTGVNEPNAECYLAIYVRILYF